MKRYYRNRSSLKKEWLTVVSVFATGATLILQILPAFYGNDQKVLESLEYNNTKTIFLFIAVFFGGIYLIALSSFAAVGDIK